MADTTKLAKATELLRRARDFTEQPMHDIGGSLTDEIDTFLAALRATHAAEPVAWLHQCDMEADCDAENGAVISAKSKELWMGVSPKWVEHYTIPLYAAINGPAACTNSTAPSGAQQEQHDDNDGEGSDRGQQGMRSVCVERGRQGAGTAEDGTAGQLRDDGDSRRKVCGGEGDRRLRELATQAGWICPACKQSNSPTVRECGCKGNRTLRERIHTP